MTLFTHKAVWAS